MFKEFIETTLSEHAIWLTAAYAGVVVAMAVDLISGLHKSRRRGIRLNSRGYKRTCDKAMKYFLPMICLSCIDIIAAAFISFPVLTMVYSAYCIFCELKSVMESTYEKEEISRGLSSVGAAINDADDMKSLVKKIIVDLLGSDMRED